MAEASRVASSPTRRAPAGELSSPHEDSEPDRPKLDVVDNRRATSSTSRRQAVMLRALGVLFVVGALATTAVAHALLASQQQRVDTLQSQLGQAVVTQQDLQLSRAELESAARVLQVAEKQLGMVVPGSVSYLVPVDPGPTVAQAEAAAARALLRTHAGAGKKEIREHGSRTATRSADIRRGTPATTLPNG